MGFTLIGLYLFRIYLYFSVFAEVGFSGAPFVEVTFRIVGAE